MITVVPDYAQDADQAVASLRNWAIERIDFILAKESTVHN
jgi:hypothetical protein